MDNLEEMDKFSEKQNFPKLNQEEMGNLNRQIITMEIGTVIRNLQTKAQDRRASQLNSTKKYREALTHNLLKLFQKIA